MIYGQVFFCAYVSTGQFLALEFPHRLKFWRAGAGRGFLASKFGTPALRKFARN